MSFYRGGDGMDGTGASDHFKTGQVYARLKRLLISQNVPAHRKLDPGLLAHRLKVSRTPVREALIRLAIEEVILNIPGNGFFSKPMNAEDIAEDYELALTILRHVIDADLPLGGRSRLRLPPDLGSMMAAAQAPDAALFFKDVIEDFYERLARMSGNRKYLQIVHMFNCRTGLVRTLDLERPDRFAQISADMGELMELLGKQDRKAAITNLDNQFKGKIDILNELVREGNRRCESAGANWLERLA